MVLQQKEFDHKNKEILWIHFTLNPTNKNNERHLSSNSTVSNRILKWADDGAIKGKLLSFTFQSIANLWEVYTYFNPTCMSEFLSIFAESPLKFEILIWRQLCWKLVVIILNIFF